MRISAVVVASVGASPEAVAHAIQCAAANWLINRIAVSTDSKEVAMMAEATGADVSIRPAALSKPETPKSSIVRYTASQMRERGFAPQLLVIIEPMASLTPKMIDDAILRRHFSPAVSAASYASLYQMALSHRPLLGA